MKQIVIWGGPDSAGKTTVARKLLPKFPRVEEFLNAGEFARALHPMDPESVAFAAGRKLLDRLQELITLKRGFGLESTLAGRSLGHLLNRCKSSDWRITLLFL